MSDRKKKIDGCVVLTRSGKGRGDLDGPSHTLIRLVTGALSTPAELLWARGSFSITPLDPSPVLSGSGVGWHLVGGRGYLSFSEAFQSCLLDSGEHFLVKVPTKWGVASNSGADARVSVRTSRHAEM